MAAIAATLSTAALTGCQSGKDTASPAVTSAQGGSVDGTTATPQAAATAEADAAPTDVCLLLTREELGKLVDSQLTTAKPEVKDGEHSCEYDNSTGTGSITVAVSATTQKDFEAEGQGYPQISGVGDGAYSASVLLYARHGDFKIFVSAAGGDSVRSTIARKVIEKLD